MSLFDDVTNAFSTVSAGRSFASASALLVGGCTLFLCRLAPLWRWQASLFSPSLCGVDLVRCGSALFFPARVVNFEMHPLKCIRALIESVECIRAHIESVEMLPRPLQSVDCRCARLSTQLPCRIVGKQ
jgi:hypothetical protein